MAKQNVSVQFTEQGSENAGGKRFIKLNFIYRNNYHNMCMHPAKCCRSGFVFLHSDLLHTISTILPARAGPLLSWLSTVSSCRWILQSYGRCLELVTAIHSCVQNAFLRKLFPWRGMPRGSTVPVLRWGAAGRLGLQPCAAAAAAAPSPAAPFLQADRATFAQGDASKTFGMAALCQGKASLPPGVAFLGFLSLQLP